MTIATGKNKKNSATLFIPKWKLFSFLNLRWFKVLVLAPWISLILKLVASRITILVNVQF